MESVKNLNVSLAKRETIDSIDYTLLKETRRIDEIVPLCICEFVKWRERKCVCGRECVRMCVCGREREREREREYVCARESVWKR